MLSSKRRAFVEEYLKDFNATRAAKAAGYAATSAHVQGSRLLSNDKVSAAVQQAIAERCMGRDEVLLRLADIARGDVGEFMNIDSMAAQLDLPAAKEKGLTKLIKKLKQTTTYSSKDGEDSERTVIEIELYDAQAALTTIGKHLRLFDDNLNVSGEVKVSGFDDLLKKVYGDGGA